MCLGGDRRGGMPSIYSVMVLRGLSGTGGNRQRVKGGGVNSLCWYGGFFGDFLFLSGPQL